MNNTNKIIGRKLKELRLKYGKTLKECGEIIGVAHSTYAGYESGFRSISAIDLVTLLDSYNVNADTFFHEVIKEANL